MFDDIQPPLKDNKDRPEPTNTEEAIQQAFKRPNGKTKKSRVKGRFAWWGRLSKNKRFGVIALLLLLFGTAVIGIYYFTRPASEPALEITRNEGPPAPTTVASPLTGLQVNPEEAARPVTGVMIENSRASRPQSGLREAGIVFEAIAEGGITRFLALYQEAKPQYVGPTRSLRPYYIDWFAPFEASIAHVGGSPDALKQVRNGDYRDLDQFFNAGAYWRVSSRAAPHNMYTSFDKLDKLNKDKKYTSSSFTSWPRKEESPAETVTAQSISFNISGELYNTSYTYDAKDNNYARKLAGQAHKSTSKESDKSGKQIKPKVLLALVMPYSLDGKYSVYKTTGSGTLLVFQDGTVTKGKWSKKDRKSQFEFKDAEGNTIALNPGQVWATAIASADRVKYSAK